MHKGNVQIQLIFLLYFGIKICRNTWRHYKINRTKMSPFPIIKTEKDSDLKTEFQEAWIRVHKPWFLSSCLLLSVCRSFLSNIFIATIWTCKQRAWRKKKSMPKLPWRVKKIKCSIQKVNCYPTPDILCDISVVLKFIPGQAPCHHSHTEWSHGNASKQCLFRHARKLRFLNDPCNLYIFLVILFFYLSVSSWLGSFASLSPGWGNTRC